MAYDPQQPHDIRAEIRRKLREIEAQLIKRASELGDPKSGELASMLEMTDKIHKDVKNPREAALDSEVMERYSKLSVDKATRVRTEMRSYDPSTFVEKLQDKINLSKEKRRNPKELEKAWFSLGKQYAKIFRAPPTLSFMLGPLEKGPKIRKKIVRRPKDEVHEVVKPGRLQLGEVDKSETGPRVQHLHRALRQAKGGGGGGGGRGAKRRKRKQEDPHFLEVIVDPKSFGRSVENLFHLSFLVRDGLANLEDDDDDGEEAAAEPRAPKVRVSDRPNSDVPEKSQCVVSFNYKMWEAARSKYGLADAFVEPFQREEEEEGGSEEEEGEEDEYK